MENTEKVLDQVPFFKKVEKTTEDRKTKNALIFNRLEAEILFGEILEIVDNPKDIQWVLEQLSGSLSLCAYERICDIVRENPEKEKEFEGVDPCIEVYV